MVRVLRALSVLVAALTILMAGPARAQTLELSDSRTEIVHVKRGETLTSLLVRSHAPQPDAQDASTAIQRLWSPRELKTDQEITLDFDRGALQHVQIDTGRDRVLAAARRPDGHFVATVETRALARVSRHAMGIIKTSLYRAAVDAHVPPPLLTELVRAFSYDVDFQREVQPGDRFEILYEGMADRNGRTVAAGNLVYASMTLSGKTLRLYRYVPRGAQAADYFNGQGQSVRKALLRTPIDGARLTSGFGMRMHPILGYSTMHRGIDFGAAPGTPIMAAGDGVIEQAGPNAGYGNFILLRHNATYETAYAHMSRFGPGIKPGVHVRQGQVIGYVGATGLATGPHLHYEVRIREEQVNPLTIKMMPGATLAGPELRTFRAIADELDRQVLAQHQSSLIAAVHK